MLTCISSHFVVWNIDINECTPNGGHGPCQQMCTNSNGSYYCSCPAGYSLSGYSCNGKSEGHFSPFNISAHFKIHLIVFTCMLLLLWPCLVGSDFLANWLHWQIYCIQYFTANISPIMDCSRSLLPMAFIIYYIITDINECAPNNGQGPCEQLCTNTNGSFVCSCQQGYDISGYSCYGEQLSWQPLLIHKGGYFSYFLSIINAKLFVHK